MELQTNQESFNPQPTRKPKSIVKRIWRITWISSLTVLLGGGIFLYGTSQGHQVRSMLVGTLLSSRHTGHLPFLQILLPQSEIDALYASRVNPNVVQTEIKKTKPKTVEESEPVSEVSEETIETPQPTPTVETPQSNPIQVDTIETVHYTAKIMIIPDPTTVHIVGTKHSDRGQALSELITDNGGIAGINAGGFIDPGGQGSGGQATGIVISQGKVLNLPNRDGNLRHLVAAFLPDGQFITGSYSANELLHLGVKDAVSFGPQLIVNGQNLITPAIDGSWGWAPRTAIGQAKDGSVIMIITDGRFYWDKTHRGASMSDIASMMEKYQVVNAIAMDGGGSTTMIKEGALQLQPATSTRAGMRYLPNAWVVIPH